MMDEVQECGGVAVHRILVAVSHLIGCGVAQRQDKPLVWLKGEVKTPPFGAAARLAVGLLLRRCREGNR